MTAAARSTQFAVRDWLLLATVAAMWGSSFVLIKIGIVDLAPTTVAWLRLLFGTATLAAFPSSRRPLRNRRDWPLVAVLGVCWMAVPFLLFPLAEQSIPSAVAGMINGAAPLFTAAIAAGWSRRLPVGTLLAGLLIGFIGVVAVNLPAARGGAGILGLGLVLLATFLYGVAFNLTEPLEGRNGPLPVIWRAQIVALVVDTPAGVIGLTHSTPSLGSVAAMAGLGVASTGLAFAAFTVLVGRVGSARASVTVYLVPVVAILLGLGVYGEPIAPLSLLGIVLVLLGAWLSARGSRGIPGPESRT
ncbi:MAG TPA: DMT family transporter [Nocardioidaceae bacterium]|nr:DMT family transporter [Nocardioidaceae bacterium]